MMIFIIAWMAIAFESSRAEAGQSCEEAFSAMHKFEVENQESLRSALEVTFQGLAKNDICTSHYLDAQDRVDSYYIKLAGFAKNFVSSCRGNPKRANDVFLYDLPEIQGALPSSVRNVCENLTK